MPMTCYIVVSFSLVLHALKMDVSQMDVFLPFAEFSREGREFLSNGIHQGHYQEITET